jgi:hypothetical protein
MAWGLLTLDFPMQFSFTEVLASTLAWVYIKMKGAAQISDILFPKPA